MIIPSQSTDVMASSFDPAGLKLNMFNNRADLYFLRLMALRDLRDHAPAWSPFATAPHLPGDIATIFPLEYFAEMFLRPASPTQIRRLRNHIAKARLRDLTPEWFPDVDLTANDIPHLYALAASIGAHALIDLNDFMWFDFKLVDRIANHALDIRDTYKPFRKKLMGYAVDGACGFLGEPTFAKFFISLCDPEAMETRFGRAMFAYIVDGVGEHVLQADARRQLKSDDPQNVRAARAFLHLPDPETPVAPEAQPPRSETTPQATPAPEELPRPVIQPSISKWIPPVAAEGVVLTQRALRELRAERNWPAERLDAALAALAAYRAMKLGQITLAAYNEQLAADRLADHLCFADPGTLKAYASDYSVTHNGRKFLLDRHIKWGRGRNATTGLRVYYAWDAERAEIIVGSMPRHLPTRHS